MFLVVCRSHGDTGVVFESRVEQNVPGESPDGSRKVVSECKRQRLLGESKFCIIRFRSKMPHARPLSQSCMVALRRERALFLVDGQIHGQ
jgi:hypothetical protein